MHQMWLGGGFGRRLDADMMVPAVQAAKAVGKPVKVIYSREDDMTMDFSRRADVPEDQGRSRRGRKLIAMNHDVVSACRPSAGASRISCHLRSTRKGRSMRSP